MYSTLMIKSCKRLLLSQRAWPQMTKSKLAIFQENETLITCLFNVGSGPNCTHIFSVTIWVHVHDKVRHPLLATGSRQHLAAHAVASAHKPFMGTTNFCPCDICNMLQQLDGSKGPLIAACGFNFLFVFFGGGILVWGFSRKWELSLQPWWYAGSRC